MWTKMARERVVMQGLRPGETTARAHADECHAVWSSPLQYLYVMTSGSISERTSFLANFHAPAPSKSPAAAPVGSPRGGGDEDATSRPMDGAADSKRSEHSALMRDALQEARRKSREDAADVVESGALTGRFVAAGTAFALMTFLRSPRAPLPDAWRDASGANSSDAPWQNASAPRFFSPRPIPKRFLWGSNPSRGSAGGDARNASAVAGVSSPQWSAAPLLDVGVSNGTAASLADRAALYAPPEVFDYVIVGAGAAGHAAAGGCCLNRKPLGGSWVYWLGAVRFG